MSRKRFTFWLDNTKNEENELIEQVDTLKQKRTFSKTIRDGIRLVTSLSTGSMDVLFELFPFVQAEFLQYVESLQINTEQGEKRTLTAQNDTLQKRVIELEAENATLRERNLTLKSVLEEEDEHIAELEAELNQHNRPSSNDAVLAELKRLNELLLKQGNVPLDSPQSTKSSGIGLKGLSSAGSGVGLKGAGLGANFTVAAPVFDDDPVIEIKKLSGAAINAAFLQRMQNPTGENRPKD